MAANEEILAFTKELVETPSQNGIDSEEGVARLVFDKLQSFGLQPQIIGPAEHPSVICSIDRGGKRTVWLESCLDTVPVGNEDSWTHSPLETTVEDNRMYGRGVGDSKVGVALFCYLARELAQDESFEGNLFLGFDAEEQGGQFTGIKEVLKHAPDADVCVLGYQGNEEISIGARGWLRLRVEARGTAAHTGSRSKRGDNAIHYLTSAVEKLRQLDFEQTEPYFEYGSAFNVSKIEGGVAINIVPEQAEALIDMRLIPSQDKDEVLQAVQKTLDELDGEYSVEELQSEPAYLSDSETEFIRVLKTYAEKVLGREVPFVASGQGSVGNVVSQKGIPIVNAFGVETGNVHAPDEWVNIESVEQVFEIYRQAIAKYAKQRDS